MKYESIIFKDRKAAGTQLSNKLSKHITSNTTPVVFAMAGGGAVTGYQIAESFGVPLDVVVSRPIYATAQSKVAYAAIAPGDVISVDRPIQKKFGISDTELTSCIHEELGEMKRQMMLYDSGVHIPHGSIDTAILVDDGSSEAVTILAAIESVKVLHNPSKILFVTPVCSHEMSALIRDAVGDIVCLSHPAHVSTILNWYSELGHVLEREVVALLEKAHEFCKMPQQAFA